MIVLREKNEENDLNFGQEKQCKIEEILVEVIEIR